MKLIKSLLNKACAGSAALALTVGVSLGAHAAETITYFHNDVSGSPMAATDASGALLWKENYRPYGDKLNNQPASSNNKIGFAGKPYDAGAGLSYMGARYYDPVIGRFTGTDPQSVAPDDLQSFNRYAYANNNPYRYVDPDGNSPLDVAFLAYDIGKLGLAIWSGNPAAVFEASVDVALSTVGVVSPVPGTGQVLKGMRVAERGVKAIQKVERAAKEAENLREAGQVAEKIPKYARNKYSSVTKSEKKRVLEESPTCVYCEKSPSTTVDHIRSQKQDWLEGGWRDSKEARSARVNDKKNLTGACNSCNSSKGSRELGKEWMPPKDR